MKIEFPSIKSRLSGKRVLLITNDARTKVARKRLPTTYPPDTLFIYQQAGCVLGAHVFQLSFDEAIKHLSNSDESKEGAVIVNLASGFKSIALEGVVPGLAGLHGIPVFPADLLNQVIAEDKLMSKRMAILAGLQCATTLTETELKQHKGPIIVKPIVGGDSVGIEKFESTRALITIPEGHFIEEFIEGGDVTIHLWWNSSKNRYEFLDCLLSDSKAGGWFDRSAKMHANLIFSAVKSSRKSISIGQLSKGFQRSVLDFLESVGHPYLARLDFRRLAGATEFNSASMFFLEINAIPTISNANDWWPGLQAFQASKHQEKMINDLEQMPIHSAAKSLAFLIHEFYVQSLSKHKDN